MLVYFHLDSSSDIMRWLTSVFGRLLNSRISSSIYRYNGITLIFFERVFLDAAHLW